MMVVMVVVIVIVMVVVMAVVMVVVVMPLSHLHALGRVRSGLRLRSGVERSEHCDGVRDRLQEVGDRGGAQRMDGVFRRNDGGLRARQRRGTA